VRAALCLPLFPYHSKAQLSHRSLNFIATLSLQVLRPTIPLLNRPPQQPDHDMQALVREEARKCSLTRLRNLVNKQDPSVPWYASRKRLQEWLVEHCTISVFGRNGCSKMQSHRAAAVVPHGLQNQLRRIRYTRLTPANIATPPPPHQRNAFIFRVEARIGEGFDKIKALCLLPGPALHDVDAGGRPIGSNCGVHSIQKLRFDHHNLVHSRKGVTIFISWDTIAPAACER
jgi:hypothetical protein